MIDPSSTEDESDEEFVPRRTKTGKKQTIISQESDAKELSLPPADVPSVTHLPNRVQETESKLPRCR